MAIKTSSGLRNFMLVTGAFRGAMNGGTLKVYGGAVPADADAAIGAAILLSTVTNASTATGVTFAATASGGTVTKTASEVWSGLNAVSGTATFYRLLSAADTGVASATESRVQGLISTAGADLNLSSVALAAGATQTVDFYSIALPTS